MIKSVHFENFKVLREATLPLSRFTLIVGPNGSGKSTALFALQAMNPQQTHEFQRLATVGLELEWVQKSCTSKACRGAG